MEVRVLPWGKIERKDDSRIWELEIIEVFE